jgi:hypothetical protein
MGFDHRGRVVRTALILAAFSTVTTITWRVWPAEPSLVLARLESVGAGMTRAQVREAVGTVPGDHPCGSPLFYRVGVRCGNRVNAHNW